MFGINPPQFEEEDTSKKLWFSSIFKWFTESTKTVNVTTAYTVPADVAWVRCDATGGAFAVTLPDCASNWRREIGFIKIDSSGNAVTVTRAGSDVINGATTKALSTQYDKTLLKSSGGTSWDVMI